MTNHDAKLRQCATEYWQHLEGCDKDSHELLVTNMVNHMRRHFPPPPEIAGRMSDDILRQLERQAEYYCDGKDRTRKYCMNSHYGTACGSDGICHSNLALAQNARTYMLPEIRRARDNEAALAAENAEQAKYIAQLEVDLAARRRLHD